MILGKRCFLQGIFHELVNFHNRSLITTSVAIVGCWEYSDDVSLVGPVVSIHHELMGSTYQLQVVSMIELFWDVLTEGVTSTSGWDTPTASIIGIWPEQIANGTLWIILVITNWSELTLHEAPPELYQVILFSLECQYWERDLRGDRIFDPRQQQLGANNQRAQWIISIHWHFHTFLNIHHRNRT
jgi:hypothetical protein